MVEGVVEVEAVTCCAGDTACPIAVASALEQLRTTTTGTTAERCSLPF